jgi:hypothetical protein
LTEGSRAIGIGFVGGFCGINGGAEFIGIEGADASELVEGIIEASRVSAGDSTCCAVELKHRPRLGRRKVGGSARDDIRASKMDLLMVLLNI